MKWVINYKKLGLAIVYKAIFINKCVDKYGRYILCCQSFHSYNIHTVAAGEL